MTFGLPFCADVQYRSADVLPGGFANVKIGHGPRIGPPARSSLRLDAGRLATSRPQRSDELDQRGDHFDQRHLQQNTPRVSEAGRVLTEHPRPDPHCVCTGSSATAHSTETLLGADNVTSNARAELSPASKDLLEHRGRGSPGTSRWFFQA